MPSADQLDVVLEPRRNGLGPMRVPLDKLNHLLLFLFTPPLLEGLHILEHQLTAATSSFVSVPIPQVRQETYRVSIIHIPRTIRPPRRSTRLSISLELYLEVRARTVTEGYGEFDGRPSWRTEIMRRLLLWV